MSKWLAVALTVSLLAGVAGAQDVVYREIFPDPGEPDGGTHPVTGEPLVERYWEPIVEGWNGTTDGQTSYALSHGFNSAGSPLSGSDQPVNSNPIFGDPELNSWAFWSPQVSDVLIWTDEIGDTTTVDAQNLVSWSLDVRNNAATPLHLALQVDETWYVAIEPIIDPEPGSEDWLQVSQDLTDVLWQTLDVDSPFAIDGSTVVGLTGETGLDAPAGTVEAAGFYTPAVTGNLRFDSYALVIPEPATMGLLALGGLAVLRRRR